LKKGKLKSTSILVISILLAILSVNLLITKVSGSSIITNEYYLEDFTDLSSSNNHINMTTENGDLQLNYSIQQFSQSNPSVYPINDNWTEDLVYTPKWSVFGTVSGVPALDPVNKILNNKSVIIPGVISVFVGAPLPTPSFITVFDMSSSPINIKNYDVFTWFFKSNINFVYLDALVLTELRFTDSSNNYTSIYPSRSVTPIWLGGLFNKYTEDLSDFIDSDSDSTPFDWTSVEYIEWGFQLSNGLSVGNPFNMWFDGLGFERNYNQTIHSDTGVWYSENISVPVNKRISSISYNGTNLGIFSSINVSNDNTNWVSVTITNTNLSGYNWNNMFIKVEMLKIGVCISPTLDYLLVSFESIPKEPPDYTLFWVLILVGSISGTVVASVLGTRQVYKSMRIKRMKF
jgi:hypothetical protein